MNKTFKKPAYVFGFVVLVVLVVIAVVLVGVITNGDEETDTKPPATPTEVLHSDPPELVASKAALSKQVDGFVSAYFARDASLYSEGLDQAQARYVSRLNSFVTQDFLELYAPSLSTEAFASAFTDGAGVRASVVANSVSGHMDEEGAELMLDVQIIPFDDKREYKPRIITVEIVVVQAEQKWLVFSINEVDD